MTRPGAGERKLRGMAVRPGDRANVGGISDPCRNGEIASVAVGPDKQMIANLGPGSGAAIGSKIIAMSEQAERDRRHLFRHKGGLLGRVHPHTDIHLLVEQVGAGIADFELDREPRVLVAQAAKHGRQDFLSHEFGDAEPDPARGRR